MGRRAVKELARKMVVTERARLESMRRAIRGLGIGERNRKAEVNGAVVESSAAESSRERDVVNGDDHSNAMGDAVADLGQEPDDIMLPLADQPQVEDLVEGPSDEPDEETPLLDLAAEAPEQLDGTAAPASEDAVEDDTPPELPRR